MSVDLEQLKARLAAYEAAEAHFERVTNIFLAALPPHETTLSPRRSTTTCARSGLKRTARSNRYSARPLAIRNTPTDVTPKSRCNSVQNILGNFCARTLEELKERLQFGWQRIRYVRLPAHLLYRYLPS